MSTSAPTHYEATKARLRDQLAAAPPGAPVRLDKATSNLFRVRERTRGPRLTVDGLDRVFSVDPVARTAQVGGMTTYEDLLDATLAHGVMPLVVPQLKTITLGGAVSGLGIESSSFRNGMPHESVREMELLTGDGRIVVARPDNEHRDLFFGFPNSYGTLGYALRLEIELEPVKPFVKLRHVPFDERGAFFTVMDEVCTQHGSDGEQVDFVDGAVFGPHEMYLTLGTFVDEAPQTSDYTGMGIYYRSLQQRRTDHLTVRDYLWRWDTDWFWCSRVFGVQNPRVRRLVPKRYLRSSTYWKLVDLEKRYGPYARIQRRRGRPEQEHVVQDIEVPIERSAEFFDFFVGEIPILPFWVCPLRARERGARWDLYALAPDATYVNFGFWSSVPRAESALDGTHNRRIEQRVTELGGHKSLYSDSFYARDEFWRLYNGEAYAELKREYDGDGRLLDLYQKCVERG